MDEQCVPGVLLGEFAFSELNVLLFVIEFLNLIFQPADLNLVNNNKEKGYNSATEGDKSSLRKQMSSSTKLRINTGRVPIS